MSRRMKGIWENHRIKAKISPIALLSRNNHCSHLPLRVLNSLKAKPGLLDGDERSQFWNQTGLNLIHSTITAC